MQDNPFSTFVSGYGQGQNLQAQRQAQSDQQDALQAQQDAQAAALQYQQGQDTQRQANTDRAFDAGQTQQGIENKNADARLALDTSKAQVSEDVQKARIAANRDKMEQSLGKQASDNWYKIYNGLIQGGTPVNEAETRAWVMVHHFDHQGNEITPQAAAHMGQNNLQPFSQVGGQPQQGQNPFGQGGQDLSQSVPSVIPPAPAPGVGGAPNPLQTPQITAPNGGANTFDLINQMGQQIRGENPGGLSGAPLPTVQQKMDLQKAQEEKVRAQIQTENALRDPKVQNLISTYTDRDANTAEMQRRDRSLEEFRNQSLAAKKAFQSVQQAMQEAKLDKAGHTTDFKAVTALRGLQRQVDAYDTNAAKINDTISKLQQQKQTFTDMMNAPPPPANNPAAVQAYNQLKTIGPNTIMQIDADIKRHTDELNTNNEKMKDWRAVLQQHRQEIDSAGAPASGGDGAKVPNAMSFGLLPLGSGTPRKPVGTIKPKNTGTTKKGNSYKVLP